MAKSYLSEILPEEYISKHEILLYYNDLLVNLLEVADKYSLSSTCIDIKDDKELPKDNEDLMDWMFENGYEDKAYTIAKAHIFFSLAKDFIIYMHESFDCSERGKVTVAYTLSRKPIKDSLFYFCWLLIDEKDFIDKMTNQDTKEYDVSKMDSEKKKYILNEASKLVQDKHEDDLFYNIIYKRDSPYGMSSIWDQSLHLVTGNKNYPTESGNLNFVFSSDEIWNEFWKHYYDKMPLIMQFAMEVIVNIFESIAKPDNNIVIINKMIRQLKFYQSYFDDFDNSSLMQFIDGLNEHIEFSIKCEYCSKEIEIKDKVKQEFVDDYLFTCPHCDAEMRVGTYLLDSEYNYNKED